VRDTSGSFAVKKDFATAIFSKLMLNLEIKRYVIPYFYLYLHGQKALHVILLK